MDFVFQAIAEDKPGPKWQALFQRFWPAYERWFLKDGEQARPRYLSSLRALRAHMPKLVPTYERLVELGGDSDLVARFLSSFCPPSYLLACSQAVWSDDAPLLVRNYDYSPQLCEGVILKTAWNGRRVISMNDCMWGALDGINEDGLAVSLSFGGRQVIGAGFGVPLVLRYVLEFCTTTDEAIEVFERVVAHANPLGLFSEDIEPETGRLLGNFPQAYTHVGLIHAAMTIGALRDARDGRVRAWS